MEKKITCKEWMNQLEKVDDIIKGNDKEKKIDYIYYLGGIMSWKKRHIIKKLKTYKRYRYYNEISYLKNNVKLKNLSNETLNYILKFVQFFLIHYYWEHYDIVGDC